MVLLGGLYSYVYNRDGAKDLLGQGARRFRHESEADQTSVDETCADGQRWSVADRVRRSFETDSGLDVTRTMKRQKG